MSNDDLFSQLLGVLDPRSLQAIAGRIGAQPSQIASAAGVALPLLLGALGRNAARPGGAEAIHSALQRDHSGLDLGSVLTGALGGGGSGAAILGHILGKRTSSAADAVGQASGLGRDQALQLLATLAPLVMAALGSHSRKAGLDPAGLAGALGRLGGQLSGGGGLAGAVASAVLDRDGDGDVDLSDLLAAAKGAGAQQEGGLGGLLGSLFGKR